MRIQRGGGENMNWQEDKRREHDNGRDEELEWTSSQLSLLHEMLTLCWPQILWSAALYSDIRAGACVQILHCARIHRSSGVHRAATKSQQCGDCDLGLLRSHAEDVSITPPYALSFHLHSYSLSSNLISPRSSAQRASLYHTASSTARTCIKWNKCTRK